jgi:tripartite-type tricarboxylate transporter receptor subunit TctC
LALPDLHKRLTEMGAVVTPLNGKDFAAFIQAEMKKWSDVITQNHIKF